MSGQRRILIGVLVGAVAGAVVVQEVARRMLARRYYDVVRGREQVESQFREVLTTHRQLNDALHNEQQRSRELSDALAAMRTQMEEAVGRLAEETRTVRELQIRLAATQGQMSQLQGELAMTLQEPRGSARAKEPSSVQLERIVVGNASASGLQGRILSVHREWNFVVIDMGWDTVRIGDTVSIFRNEQLLAKARVEQVQEGLCAATVLLEWGSTELRVNDLVRIL